MEFKEKTDYPLCFGCGPQNLSGLQMEFRLEGEEIVSDFTPKEEHQGFAGVIHGGVVAAALDEALDRTSTIAHHPGWSVTGRLEMHYRHPVPYGPRLRVRASFAGQRGR